MPKIISFTPSISILNVSSNLILSKYSLTLSNPNTPKTYEIASFTKSRSEKISELKNPFIAPAIAPTIPSFPYPSIAPLTVSQRVNIIVSGRKILPTIFATVPIRPVNFPRDAAILPKVSVINNPNFEPVTIKKSFMTTNASMNGVMIFEIVLVTEDKNLAIFPSPEIKVLIELITLSKNFTTAENFSDIVALTKSNVIDTPARKLAKLFLIDATNFCPPKASKKNFIAFNCAEITPTIEPIATANAVSHLPKAIPPLFSAGLLTSPTASRVFNSIFSKIAICLLKAISPSFLFSLLLAASAVEVLELRTGEPAGFD